MNYIDKAPDGMQRKPNWPVLAAAWELVALSFRYPTDELADAVQSGEWLEAVEEIADVLGLQTPAGFHYVATNPLGTDVAGGDGTLHALRVEATHLFVGVPHAACPPYQSVWAAREQGVDPLLFVNPASRAVEGFLRACGLVRPEATNEPLDHVATEAEALQYLATAAANELPGSFPGGSAEAAYHAFLEEHLRSWVGAFCASVLAEARLPFYRAAAQFLRALANPADGR